MKLTLLADRESLVLKGAPDAATLRDLATLIELANAGWYSESVS